MVLIYTLLGLAMAFVGCVIYTLVRAVVDPEYNDNCRKELEEKRRKKAEARRRYADYRVRMYEKTGDVRYINDPYFRSPNKNSLFFTARRKHS